MRTTFALLPLLIVCPLFVSGADKKIESQVEAITKAAILIDTHNDIPSFTVAGADIGNSPKTHTDIERLKKGGVGAVFFSVYVAATYVNGNHSANRHYR